MYTGVQFGRFQCVNLVHMMLCAREAAAFVMHSLFFAYGC